MKRQRDESEDEGSDEKKKCTMRWARKKSCNSSSHGVEQRSGGGGDAAVVTDVVVVVGASSSLPFKTTAVVPTTPPTLTTTPMGSSTSAYLLQLRKLASKALNFGQCIPELLSHISKKFLGIPTEASWSEECEAVMTALYIPLHHPGAFAPYFAQEIVVQFLKRWIADYEATEEKFCITRLITTKRQYKDLSLLLLVFANHFPNEVDAVCLKDCLAWGTKWSQNNVTLPDWLLEVSEHQESLISLRKLLFASAMMLKGEHFSIDYMEDYAGSMTAFLYASQSYKTADYAKALDTLQDIKIEKCSNDLQGWILWLMGLSLFHIGKPHIALVKLQAAVDMCDACIPAIFNISQVFSKLCVDLAELETLTLLYESGKDWNPYPVANLHSALLRLHHSIPDDLSCRALYLLAVRSFQMTKYKDSCNHFAELLQNLQSRGFDSNPNQRILLRSKDNIPELPSYEKIMILQALALFQSVDFEGALRSVSDLELKEFMHSSYYEGTEDEKISCLTTVTAYWIKSEALLKLERTDEALQECLRLDRLLSLVRATSGSGWDICVLMFRTLAYWLLSVLHNLKCNAQSHNHFKRLSMQSLRLVSQDRTNLLCENQSLASKLIMDTIFCIMDDKLSMVQ